MSRILAKIKEWSTLAPTLYVLSFIIGFFPIYTANIVANDEDFAYLLAIAVMVAVAGLWGLLAYAWLAFLGSKKSAATVVNRVPGTLTTLAMLYVVYDVDRTPVYLVSLGVPGILALLQKRRWMFLASSGILAVFLICSFTPSSRIRRAVSSFQGDCWCCGYQQKDIRQLISQGDPGCKALIECITRGKESYPQYGWNNVCSYALRELKDSRLENRETYMAEIERLKEQ